MAVQDGSIRQTGPRGYRCRQAALVAGYAVEQQPVGLDMQVTEAVPIAFQGMVTKCGWEWLAWAGLLSTVTATGSATGRCGRGEVAGENVFGNRSREPTSDINPS